MAQIAAMARPARYPSLEGASAYVTGGSSGIGADIVRALARQGAKVAFCGRDATAAEALIAELSGCAHRPMFQRLDVRDVDALQAGVRAAGDAQGPLNVLINNAADDTRHAFDEMTSDYWDDRVAVNLRQMAFAAQAAARQMRANGGGAIVNLGSIAWKLKLEGAIAYSACKAAVTGLTRSLARELGADNIRVNTLSPGWVMTERQIKLWLTPDGEAELERGQCLNVRLSGADIAAMAVFLCAEDSRYCTAQEFIVDAGWS